MCLDAATIGKGVGALKDVGTVAGAVGTGFSLMNSFKKPKFQAPTVPVAPPVPPARQTAQTPNEVARRTDTSDTLMRRRMASSTLLTGPFGIKPDLLSLGKATLLGE